MLCLYIAAGGPRSTPIPARNAAYLQMVLEMVSAVAYLFRANLEPIPAVAAAAIFERTYLRVII